MLRRADNAPHVATTERCVTPSRFRNLEACGFLAGGFVLHLRVACGEVLRLGSPRRRPRVALSLVAAHGHSSGRRALAPGVSVEARDGADLSAQELLVG